MKIFIEKQNKNIEKKFSGKIKDLLKDLKINSDTVLVVKDKELITEEDLVSDKDSVKILSVISGG
ncbi:MoaD/ThiS family protein [Candidatus Woesearchaeota archaeon]|nr:MoaD/ThiS family protein [Candidatus Woesearchaeota archaeon]